MPNGHTDHDTYVPHAFEFVFKAVEYGRVCCHVVPYKGYGWQVFRTGDIHFLLIDLCGKFQTAHFRSHGIYIIYIDAAVVCGSGR